MSVGAVEVARRLNLSRATVYRRIGGIREVFHAAGLEGYLGQFQPTCSSPRFRLR
jgi:AcrR family transcriptional regulator